MRDELVRRGGQVGVVLSVPPWASRLLDKTKSAGFLRVVVNELEKEGGFASTEKVDVSVLRE